MSLSLSWLKDKHIFITGVSGFVGKSVLERLWVETQGQVGHVYLLIRPKAARRATEVRSVGERLKSDVYESSIFDPIKAAQGEETFRAQFFDKVSAISGDLCGPVALITHDAEGVLLRQHVQVIIHCAASIQFDEPLEKALQHNVRGALRILQLATECERLQSYVHVSTAYVNCHRLSTAYEREVPFPSLAGDDAEAILDMLDAEIENGDMTPMRQQQLLDKLGYPNTYTFSKAISEKVLLRRAEVAKLPFAIVRPSIVGAAAQYPYPGWTEAISAVGAVVFFIGLGVLRCLSGKGAAQCDIIPVDYVANAVLATTVANAHEEINAPRLIVHATLTRDGLTWSHMHLYLVEYWRAHPMSRAIADINVDWVRSPFMTHFVNIALYQVPLQFLWLILQVAPSPERQKTYEQFRKIANGVVKQSDTFGHFTNNEWTFDTTNLKYVMSRLVLSDHKRVAFDHKFDYHSYMHNFCRGMTVYTEKVDRNRPMAPSLLNSPLTFDAICDTVKEDNYAVDLQDYVDTLLFLAPPVVYMGFKALTGTRVMSLVQGSASYNLRGARWWFGIGMLGWGLKKYRYSAGIARRLKKGQSLERAHTLEAYERLLFGWGMPFVASLIYAVSPPRNLLPAGMVYQRARAQQSLALRALKGVGSIVFGRWVRPLYIAVLTWLAYGSIETASALGMRPITWSHVGKELPRWRKALLVVSMVLLVRSGKGRESQGMQQWLKAWEAGHF